MLYLIIIFISVLKLITSQTPTSISECYNALFYLQVECFILIATSQELKCDTCEKFENDFNLIIDPFSIKRCSSNIIQTYTDDNCNTFHKNRTIDECFIDIDPPMRYTNIKCPTPTPTPAPTPTPIPTQTQTSPNKITEDINTLIGFSITALIFAVCACIIICSAGIWWCNGKGYFEEGGEQY